MWQKNWNEFGLKVLVVKKIRIIFATAMAIGHTDLKKFQVILRQALHRQAKHTY